jgi:serine/threonine protein kinase
MLEARTTLKKILQGGFARVYEVSDANDVRHAVKVVAKVNLHSKKSKTKVRIVTWVYRTIVEGVLLISILFQLYAEIKLHRALKHPNIVLFGDCFEDDDHVYMSMELCQNGVRAH